MDTTLNGAAMPEPGHCACKFSSGGVFKTLCQWHTSLIAQEVKREREEILLQFEQAFKSGIKQAEDVYIEAGKDNDYGSACVAEGFKDAHQQLLANIEAFRAKEARGASTSNGDHNA
jgi:hypothetical protein